MKPMGIFRWGIDPWAQSNDCGGAPRAFTLSLCRGIKYRSFRLRIRHGLTALSDVASVDLRMFMLGDMIHMQENWEYGMTLTRVTAPDLSRTRVTAPDLSRTASGSVVPGRPQRKVRAMELTFPCLTDRDRELMAQLEEDLLGRPFIVQAYPNREGFQFNDYNFLARLGNALPYAHMYEDVHEVSNMLLLEV